MVVFSPIYTHSRERNTATRVTGILILLAAGESQYNLFRVLTLLNLFPPLPSNWCLVVVPSSHHIKLLWEPYGLQNPLIFLKIKVDVAVADSSGR